MIFSDLAEKPRLESLAENSNSRDLPQSAANIHPHNSRPPCLTHAHYRLLDADKERCVGKAERLLRG